MSELSGEALIKLNEDIWNPESLNILAYYYADPGSRPLLILRSRFRATRGTLIRLSEAMQESLILLRNSNKVGLKNAE